MKNEVGRVSVAGTGLESAGVRAGQMKGLHCSKIGRPNRLGYSEACSITVAFPHRIKVDAAKGSSVAISKAVLYPVP